MPTDHIKPVRNYKVPTVGEPGAAVLFSPATLLPFFGTMVPTHEGGTT